MNIIEKFIPEGKHNRPSKHNPCKYITIHNSGNTNKTATALNHASFVNNTNAYTSWHFTVDDTNIVQHLPEHETAYHASDGGRGTGNTQSIGIEICENGDLLKATDNAVELVIHLCKKWSIPVENIKQHYDWCGKNCPSRLRNNEPYSWNEFINKVKQGLETQEKENETMKYYETINDIPEGELRDIIKNLINKSIVNGTETGLHLSEDMCRILVYLRRANVL